jgi:hypothetical protein
MVGVKAATNGRPHAKVNALHLVEPPTVFIADGPGDYLFAKGVRHDNGVVIGVGRSPDVMPEIEQFYGVANVVLPGPEDLPAALEYAAHLLNNNGSKTFI